jgi:protein-disulfide isomerase
MRAILLTLALMGCNQTNAPASPSSVPAGSAPSAVQTPAASPTSPASAAHPAIAATWEGGSLPYDDLSKDLAAQVARMEAEYMTNRYETELDAANSKINDAILDLEAKKLNLADKDALMRQEVESKVEAPTEAEIQDAYNQLARRLGGKPLEEVRDRVVQMVVQKKQGERAQAYVDELRQRYKVVVNIPYPELPRIPVSVDDDPSEGPASAKVTIVQFAEFQCPYCGKARESIQEVMKNYDGQVRFVFRDFPLSFHDRAIPAAVAANCAAKQEKYWPMHDKIMANQRALTDEDLTRVATEVGLDLNAWNECRKDPTMEAEIRKDMQDGSAAGVTGTPAFFINGVFLSGAQPYDKFKTIIDRELGKG